MENEKFIDLISSWTGLIHFSIVTPTPPQKMLWNIKTGLGYHVFSRQYKRLDDMYYFSVTSKVPNIVQIFNKTNLYFPTA